MTKKLNIRTMLFAAMFTALTAIGAFIKIPIPPYPVPMTLQTAFIYLAGLLLPVRAAFLSQAAYVLLGLIGIPIFTSGGGFSYVLNPTFGYLLAFLFCAPLTRCLAEQTLFKGQRIRFALGGISIILAVQICGVAYMAFISYAYLASPLSFSRALYFVLIFLPLDMIKFFLASLLSLQLRKRVPSLFV